jgi:hypothetical protein
MRSRYPGTKPYTDKESDIFFGRQKEINELFRTVVFEKISILHSFPGAGKTSVLQAGVIPLLKSSNQFEIIYIDIPQYKKSNIELSETIKKNFGISANSLSFIDKLIYEPDYFWYYLKKIQSIKSSDKVIIMLFDSFENIFTYPKTIIEKFNTDLSSALYEIIPKNIKTEIREKISKNPELLTDEGSKLLYNPIKLRVLFSVRTKNLKNLRELSEFYPEIKNNKIKLDYFNRTQLLEIIEQSSGFVSKYEEKNDFITKPYKFNNELIEHIIKFLTKKNKTNPTNLQIILKYSEKLVSQKNISLHENTNYFNFNEIFGNYYNECIKNIKEKNIRESITDFAEKELFLESENRLLPVYDGIAKERYNLNINIYSLTNGLITYIIKSFGRVIRV